MHGVLAGAHVELAVEALRVTLDRVDRQEQRGSDLTLARRPREHPQDRQLAIRQFLDQHAGRRATGAGVGLTDRPAPEHFRIRDGGLDLHSDAARRQPTTACSRRCPLARSPTSDVVGSSLAAWSPTPIVLLAATRDGYRCVLADAGLPEHRLGALDPTAAAELHPATVRKLAQAATVEVLTAKTEQRAHLVDAHVEYLHPPLERGRTQRHRVVPGIAKLGYQGGELAVQRYLRRFRDGGGHAALPGPKPPTVPQVTRWVMTHPEQLDTEEADRLRQIRDADAGLDRLTIHVRGWATMMAELRGQDLERWIVAVEHDSLAPLASFARNLRRDQDAVRAGLTLQYSSGRVEGTVNKIKMLKRQMFGRANFDLLRTRVLHAS